MVSSDVLRTPDDRFGGLPGFPFDAHYETVAGLRMHYVDEGPLDAEPILMTHGLPTWSYLYRLMIPPLVAAGHRVIVPDLIGFGRSDKPSQESEYTYERHVQHLTALVDALDLEDTTLVAHDFGGMVGLRVAAEDGGKRFRRLVVLNTSLNDGTESFPALYIAGFEAWKAFWRTTPAIRTGAIIESQTAVQLAPEVTTAYDAPYPDDRYLAGLRINDTLYPLAPNAPGATENARAAELLASWPHPVLIAFSADADLYHPGQHARFSGLFPPDVIWRDQALADTRHFMQEDAPAELSRLIDEFLAST